MINNVLSHEVDQLIQNRNKRLDSYSYKLQSGGYGLDVQFGQHFDIDEANMSVTIPFADGHRRDGVGDLLEIGGIDTERHRKNPIFLFDHGKQISLPVGKTEDPRTNEYTVFIDPNSKVASCKAFFYQGGGSYEHGLFCEQLFDLVAKKFIRAGSIGYLVKAAQQLPAQYGTGIPQGLHLLSTLMLEASVVVLPANQDTIRKALSLPQVCGKPLSAYLVKSLASYVQPSAKMVTGGYGEKTKKPKFPKSQISVERMRELREEYPTSVDRHGNPIGVTPEGESINSIDNLAARYQEELSQQRDRERSQENQRMRQSIYGDGLYMMGEENNDYPSKSTGKERVIEASEDTDEEIMSRAGYNPAHTRNSRDEIYENYRKPVVDTRRRMSEENRDQTNDEIEKRRDQFDSAMDRQRAGEQQNEIARSELLTITDRDRQRILERNYRDKEKLERKLGVYGIPDNEKGNLRKRVKAEEETADDPLEVSESYQSFLDDIDRENRLSGIDPRHESVSASTSVRTEDGRLRFIPSEFEQNIRKRDGLQGRVPIGHEEMETRRDVEDHHNQQVSRLDSLRLQEATGAARDARQDYERRYGKTEGQKSQFEQIPYRPETPTVDRADAEEANDVSYLKGDKPRFYGPNRRQEYHDYVNQERRRHDRYEDYRRRQHERGSQEGEKKAIDLEQLQSKYFPRASKGLRQKYLLCSKSADLKKEQYDISRSIQESSDRVIEDLKKATGDRVVDGGIEGIEVVDWPPPERRQANKELTGSQSVYRKKATNLPFDPNRSSEEYDNASDSARAEARQALQRRTRRVEEGANPEEQIYEDWQGETFGRIRGPHDAENIQRYDQDRDDQISYELSDHEDPTPQSQQDRARRERREQHIEDRERSKVGYRKKQIGILDGASPGQPYKTNLPPARWRPGAGAIKALRQKYGMKANGDDRDPPEGEEGYFEFGNRMTDEAIENEQRGYREAERKYRQGRLTQAQRNELSTQIAEESDRAIGRAFQERDRYGKPLERKGFSSNEPWHILGANTKPRDTTDLSMAIADEQATYEGKYDEQNERMRNDQDKQVMKRQEELWGESGVHAKSGDSKRSYGTLSKVAADEARMRHHYQQLATELGRDASEDVDMQFHSENPESFRSGTLRFAEQQDLNDARERSKQRYAKRSKSVEPDNDDINNLPDEYTPQELEYLEDSNSRNRTTDHTDMRLDAVLSDESSANSMMNSIMSDWGRNNQRYPKRSKSVEPDNEMRARKEVENYDDRIKRSLRIIEQSEQQQPYTQAERDQDRQIREGIYRSRRAGIYADPPRSSFSKHIKALRQKYGTKAMSPPPQTGQRVTARVPIVRPVPGQNSGPPEYLQPPLTAVGPSSEQAVAVRDNVGRVTNAIVNDEVVAEAPKKKLRGLQRKYLVKAGVNLPFDPNRSSQAYEEADNFTRAAARRELNRRLDAHQSRDPELRDAEEQRITELESQGRIAGPHSEEVISRLTQDYPQLAEKHRENRKLKDKKREEETTRRSQEENLRKHNERETNRVIPKSEEKNFDTPESARDNIRLAELYDASMRSANRQQHNRAIRDKKARGASIHSDSRDREESQVYNQMLPEGTGEHFMQAANLNQVRRSEDSLGNQLSQEERQEREDIAARTRQRMQKPKKEGKSVSGYRVKSEPTDEQKRRAAERERVAKNTETEETHDYTRDDPGPRASKDELAVLDPSPRSTRRDAFPRSRDMADYENRENFLRDAGGSVDYTVDRATHEQLDSEHGENLDARVREQEEGERIDRLTESLPRDTAWDIRERQGYNTSVARVQRRQAADARDDRRRASHLERTARIEDAAAQADSSGEDRYVTPAEKRNLNRERLRRHLDEKDKQNRARRDAEENKSLTQKTKALRAKYSVKSAGGVFVNSHIRSKAQKSPTPNTVKYKSVNEHSYDDETREEALDQLSESQRAAGIDERDRLDIQVHGNVPSEVIQNRNKQTNDIMQRYHRGEVSEADVIALNNRLRSESARQTQADRQYRQAVAAHANRTQPKRNSVEEKDLNTRSVKTQRYPHPSKIAPKDRARRAEEQGANDEDVRVLQDEYTQDTADVNDQRSAQAAASAEERGRYQDRIRARQINADNEQIGRSREQRDVYYDEDQTPWHSDFNRNRRIESLTQRERLNRERRESEEQKSFTQRTKDLRSKYGMKSRRFPHPSKIEPRKRAQHAADRGADADSVEDLQYLGEAVADQQEYYNNVGGRQNRRDLREFHRDADEMQRWLAERDD